MGRRVVFIVAALAAACAAVLVVWAFSGGAGGEEAQGEPTVPQAASEEEGAEAGGPAGAAAGGERPGEDGGYVGPGGEGALEPEDFATEEEYNAALIEAGEPEVEIEREPIPYDETGESGYEKGILSVGFRAEFGEERAREIVENLEGVWVSDTFAWKSTEIMGYADVTLYFPESPYKEELEAVAATLRDMPEVEYASLSVWFEGLAEAEERSITGFQTNDPDVSDQYWLSFCRFNQAWEKARCSRSVSVAVFDSGIYLDHPDLSKNIGTHMPYDAFN